MAIVPLVNQALAWLTVAGQILIGLLIILLFFPGIKKRPLFGLFGKKAIFFAFLIALAATASSLFYSEIAGFPACDLCWYQRIFIYPQTILLGLAFWKKDKSIADYIIALSAVGGIIALYNLYVQSGEVPSAICQIAEESIGCAKKAISELGGYVTIPAMSLTAFVLNGLLMVSRKISRNNN